MSSMDYSDTCRKCGDERFEIHFGNSVRKRAVRCMRCKEVEPVGMTLDEYQKLAARTMKPRRGLTEDLSDYAMGLAGEAGELVNKIKKMLYHGHPWDDSQIIEEAGDLLWYAAVILKRLDIPLEAVAAYNIEKLRQRYPEGYSDERSREREPHET